MAERVVSVKLPGTLAKEVRRLTQEHHFLDVSEQVRSIVRQRCLKYMVPYDDIQGLKTALEAQVRTEQDRLQRERLLTDIAKLIGGGR
jgi:Arc/MetJ-type ribon-helix-helix transcriptional regulator